LLADEPQSIGEVGPQAVFRLADDAAYRRICICLPVRLNPVRLAESVCDEGPSSTLVMTMIAKASKLPHRDQPHGQNQMQDLNQRAHVAALSVSIALMCLSSGCANSVLYSESRDKQGQAATTAVAEVDLVSSVDALQTKFKSLADLEKVTQRARGAVSRDLVLENLTRAPDQYRPQVSVNDRYVKPLLDQRLAELGDVGDGMVVADELQRQADSKLRVLSARANATVATCNDAISEKKSGAILSKLSAVQKLVATALLNDAVAFCQKVSSATAVPAGKGEIARLKQELEDEQAGIIGSRDLLKRKKEELDNLIALSTQDSVGKTLSERLQSAAGNLQKLLSNFERTADEHGRTAVKAAEAELRFAALDEVLKALASGKTDLENLDEKERRAVLVIRFVPSIASEIDVWIRQRDRIRLAPLVIAKEHQRLVIASFAAELEAHQQRVQTRGRILASAQAEQLALARAKRVLGQDPAKLDTPFNKVLDSGTSGDRFRLFTSLTSFDEAEEHRLDAELGRLELDASATDVAIVRSRSAAMQWRNLAISIAAVLGDYHAQGVKPADLAEFFKAIGLVGIAAK
jgi:hypothetical protein